MIPFMAAASVANGLIGGIGQMFLAGKQKRLADKIHPIRSYYQTSPYARENKVIAQNAMNSSMPGANPMQQGIA